MIFTIGGDEDESTGHVCVLLSPQSTNFQTCQMMIIKGKVQYHSYLGNINVPPCVNTIEFPIEWKTMPRLEQLVVVVMVRGGKAQFFKSILLQ